MDKKKNSVSLKTKISIDFFLEIVKIYIFVEIRVLKKESEEQDTPKLDLFETKKNQTVIKRKFKVSDDFEAITIDNITYKIPLFFNRDSIRENDVKTWEMLFYYIFNDNISKEIEKLKLISQTKSKKEMIQRSKNE